MAPGGIQRNVAKQMEQSKEEEQLREGMFLKGQGKASLRMRMIYPRAEVSFSASHFPNSNLLGVYFFHIGEMKHDKAARCGPSLREHPQPAEHPVSQLAQCQLPAGAAAKTRGPSQGPGTHSVLQCLRGSRSAMTAKHGPRLSSGLKSVPWLSPSPPASQDFSLR